MNEFNFEELYAVISNLEKSSIAYVTGYMAVKNPDLFIEAYLSCRSNILDKEIDNDTGDVVS